MDEKARSAMCKVMSQTGPGVLPLRQRARRPHSDELGVTLRPRRVRSDAASESRRARLAALGPVCWSLRYPPRRSAVRRQRAIPPTTVFPCATAAKFGRSPKRPRSVHRLRPGDVDVVAAIGDSLVAGSGALEEYALGAFVEYRGVSWCAGGDGTWREFLTLPNILKEFNPGLRGYSTGTGEWLERGSRLNVAFPVASDQDALKQAKVMKVVCNVTKTKRQSTQWVFPFEEWPTKVNRGRSIGKKIVASAFRMTDHYATIVLEDKKKQSLQTGALTIVSLLFWKKFGKKIGFSFILITPRYIPPDQRLTI
ncbi:hypothetical protein EVAR_76507_1 [Eumeta japonica]|uniref:Phospholipase B1, membrane-associated n=1 Tax=Eumeta variegata TaxID=151549 RepID=A0A4C1T5S6_EUMVA|nr:hypothetical protein EVAR_76507_1 [Eumeta japonica]